MKLLKFIISLVRKSLGLDYMVNLGSMEIHDLKNSKHNCMIDKIKDRKLIRKSKLGYYLDNGFNGCRWCYKSEDNG